MTTPVTHPADPARIGTAPSPGAFRDESASPTTGLPYAPPAAPMPENRYERPASQEARVSAPAPESEDRSPSEPVLRSAEISTQTYRAGLSETTHAPAPSATSVPPFMRTKEWEVEDLTDDEYLATLERNWWSSEDEKDYGPMPLTILRQRPSARKKTAPRVFPKSVSVFGFSEGGGDYLRRFEAPLGEWGIYFPLKLVSDTLGLSPILVERVMRRVTRDSEVDVFLDAHDTAILEPKASVTIGMMAPVSLVEHFGYRDRILVDAFACFWALPELMRAKRRADLQKAARRRRAAEMMYDRSDSDDEDYGHEDAENGSRDGYDDSDNQDSRNDPDGRDDRYDQANRSGEDEE